MSGSRSAGLQALLEEIRPRAALSMRKGQALASALAVIEATYALRRWVEEQHTLEVAIVEIVESFLLEFARDHIVASQNGTLARVMPNG